MDEPVEVMIYLQAISLSALVTVLLILAADRYTKFDFLPPEWATTPVFVIGITGTGFSFYILPVEQIIFVASAVICFYIGLLWPYEW
ncbi:hypothetical protein [Natrialba hulunbeirensis]|nr:hypothetical protein [Natrialba hulunbeirensis]